MKPGLLLLFTFGVLAGTVHAATPSEQLKQLTAQLQKNPADTALREKIIKHARAMKPAPAVPAEAERFDGRGEYAFKSAKNGADYLAAADEFSKASNLAPWVPSFYFNAATAFEKGGKPSLAKRNFELYLLAAPNAGDARDVRRRIAGLEYAIEKADSPERQAAKKKEDEEAKLRTLDGAGFEYKEAIPGGHIVLWSTIDIRGRQLIAKSWQTINGKPKDEDSKNCVLVGLRCEVEQPPQYFVRKIIYEISADGRTGTISHQTQDGTIRKEAELQRVR